MTSRIPHQSLSLGRRIGPSPGRLKNAANGPLILRRAP